MSFQLIIRIKDKQKKSQRKSSVEKIHKNISTYEKQ